MKTSYKLVEMFIIPNVYSRPGSKLKEKRGIALHWVANPKSTALGNRNYFDRLKNQTTTPRRYASSHEIIGLSGEVLICIPKDEVAYHVGAKSYTKRAKELLNNSPNRYLYGIEVCHPDWTGKFNDKTYTTLINRVADLLLEFDLKPSKDTIWRHYDVTGKDCPRYYVQNEKEWNKLIVDITKIYNEKVSDLVMAELTVWQKEIAQKALDNLAKKGYVNNAEEHKKNLSGEPVQDWLFWTMIDRTSGGVK